MLNLQCSLCTGPTRTGDKVITAPNNKCTIICHNCSANHPNSIQAMRDLSLAKWCPTHQEVFALCQDAHTPCSTY